MARYIKFDDSGNAYAAPSVKRMEGGTMFGYDRPGNEAMLLEDGWMKYEGSLPLYRLALENGAIVEKPVEEPAVALPTRFTKLQIRRCLRKHGYEGVLDGLLADNAEFRKDWEDAQDIDLNDEMMQEAVAQGFIPQELIALVQSECQGV